MEIGEKELKCYLKYVMEIDLYLLLFDLFVLFGRGDVSYFPLGCLFM